MQFSSNVQMLGLNIYSYIEDNDVQFYKTQKALAKKMDLLDWLLGSYEEEIVQGGESPLDRARRIIPEAVMERVVPTMPDPIVAVHPGGRLEGVTATRLREWRKMTGKRMLGLKGRRKGV